MKLARFDCGTRSKFALSTEGGGAEPVVVAELQQTPTGRPKRTYLRGRCSYSFALSRFLPRLRPILLRFLPRLEAYISTAT